MTMRDVATGWVLGKHQEPVGKKEKNKKKEKWTAVVENRVVDIQIMRNFIDENNGM